MEMRAVGDDEIIIIGAAFSTVLVSQERRERRLYILDFRPATLASSSGG
jgi:hypothetical protein